MRDTIKKPLLFVAALLPVMIIGGFFTGIYSFDTYTSEMQNQIIAQVGSYTTRCVYCSQHINSPLICGRTFTCNYWGFWTANANRAFSVSPYEWRAWHRIWVYVSKIWHSICDAWTHGMSYYIKANLACIDLIFKKS